MTDLAILFDQVSTILKVAKALVRDIHPRAGSIDQQAYTLDKERVLSYQSLDYLVGLRMARKPEEGEAHLVRIIELTDVAISPPPRKLRTWMIELMPSIPAQTP